MQSPKICPGLVRKTMTQIRPGRGTMDYANADLWQKRDLRKKCPKGKRQIPQGSIRSWLGLLAKAGIIHSLSHRCGLLDCSTPGSSVLHYLPEFAQIHVHWVGDTILPFHLLPLPSLFCPQYFPASVFSNKFALHISSQSFGTSASVSVLPMNIQSFFLSGLTGLISLLSKELSSIFFSTTVWKHQFFSVQPSSWSSSHICIWLMEKP